MAEHTVVKEQLTDAMVDAGAALVGKLDEMGLPLTAAFWLFELEVNDWSLVLASPDVATRGPLEVYGRVQQAIDRLGARAVAVPLSSVTVKQSDADLVRRLRTTLKTVTGLKRIRFSRNVADGHFIEDALIYRVA